jgi:hypothetical protein
MTFSAWFGTVGSPNAFAVLLGDAIFSESKVEGIVLDMARR